MHCEKKNEAIKIITTARTLKAMSYIYFKVDLFST